MPVGSIAYLVLLVTGLLLFYASRAPWWRRAVISAITLAFFLAQATTLKPLALVAGFVVCSFLLTVAVSRWPLFLLRLGSITFLLAYFLLARGFWFVPEISFLSVFTTIGLSYMIFRSIHAIVEAGDELTVGLGDFGIYFRYQLIPFGLQAGPVHNYEDFAEYDEEIGNASPGREEFNRAFLRLTVGFLKVIAVAPVLLSLFHDVRGPSNFYLSAAAVLFVSYIYLNFSGYMDIVVSSAKMFGLALPENFDRPWMASSFIEFWNRWHITLSHFFRDYLFYPLMGVVSRMSSSRKVLFWNSIAVSFVVFFLLGLWHGTDPMFVWVACFFGIGVALNRIWEELAGKPFVGGMTRLSPSLGKLAAHIVGATAVFYFAFSAIPVWPGMNNMTLYITVRRLATYQGVLGFVTTIAALVALRMLTSVWDHVAKKPEGFPLWVRDLALGVNGALLVILFRLVSTAHSPQIYYQDL